MQCRIIRIDNLGGTRFVTVSVSQFELGVYLTLPAPKDAPIYVGETWRIGLTEAVKFVPLPGRPFDPNECPGHGREGKGEKCCDRAGESNGYYDDGPLLFVCPKHCSCHEYMHD